MPGMNSGLNSNNPTVVAAFRSALLHQGLIVLAVFAVLALAWLDHPANGCARRRHPPPPEQVPRLSPDGGSCCGSASASSGSSTDCSRPSRPWPWACPSQVIQPAAASSPGWVQHIVNWAGTSWSYHPIQAGAAAGLDPDRSRGLADHRVAGAVVPAGRAGQRRLGAGGLGVRRGFRRYLRARPDLAVRRARGRSVLPGRRPADRRTAAQLADTTAGTDSAGRAGRFLHRHGAPAGLARPRLLAGHRGTVAAARWPAWSNP